ncbi:tetratricopeptide repeat protein [Falsiroseomonas selenitidurans]|uniref:Sel1 repeat family protein n=1 Tax=Falsiroseomonas selenitidurans TaxID=2716335 RepID=A0ABX1E2F8_9PROT|nr:tetratricopeptide repeat protein [Falsiroseomonas selenitidurans]NKC31344.1 sel1 repeat family protein [Falsiroseomonas selenitidurans]
MRAALAPALGLALGLAGCAPPPTVGGFGPDVRICQGADCRVVSNAEARSGEPQTDRRGERQSDPDLYRGENVAQLRAAAESGDARAAYKLGQAAEFGLGGSARQPAEALRWYGVAAQAGLPWAQFRLAEALGRAPAGRRDNGRIIELTAASARGGVAQAAYNLGMMHLAGQGVMRDAQEAGRWLRLAAEEGVPEAQYNLGLLYYRGEGVPQQLYDALQFMRRAAESGYVPAQRAVGRLYMTGLDTMRQDLREARTFMSLAAAAGDSQARAWMREIERAEREQEAYRRQLQAQANQTAALFASVALAAMLAPPPVVVYSRW